MKCIVCCCTCTIKIKLVQFKKNRNFYVELYMDKKKTRRDYNPVNTYIDVYSYSFLQLISIRFPESVNIEVKKTNRI